jgi:hypothetical protein
MATKHSNVANVNERCREPLKKPARFQFTIRDVIVLTVVAAAAAAAFAYYYAPRPSLAEKTRAAALVQAKKQGKQVLMVYGVRGTSWSDRLDQYHADADVRRVLEKHFVLARVDIEEPGGMEMYMERGPRGSPAFSILDAGGDVVADSGENDQNVGFPNKPEEVDRYTAALKTACPAITDDDLAVLRHKLEAMRVPPE